MGETDGRCFSFSPLFIHSFLFTVHFRVWGGFAAMLNSLQVSCGQLPDKSGEFRNGCAFMLHFLGEMFLSLVQPCLWS